MGLAGGTDGSGTIPQDRQGTAGLRRALLAQLAKGAPPAAAAAAAA
eukprot:gene26552-15737_t